ncbi:TIGR04197 family type VII secretion effector [Erwinia sp. CPCC 100877]|nr:TIGR04197 family type VII secretion effector [Erwinia sp. CPCC 100877]
MKINSSLSVAGGVSAQMNKAASGLSSVAAAATTANRTSVSGNTNAKNSIAAVHSRGQRLSNVIARDGNNIHSVAKEFAAIDQKVQASISDFSLGGKF